MKNLHAVVGQRTARRDCRPCADAEESRAAERVVRRGARALHRRSIPHSRPSGRRRPAQQIEIRQSHGGSSKQARAVAEGLQADVVTFNQVTDISSSKGGSRREAAGTSVYRTGSPYYSLPVFLVRGGQSEERKDWDDLAKPGVQSVFPNPKTSGNGRYTYLAAVRVCAWKNADNDAKASAFVGSVLKNVPVFDTGGRGATTTFVERQIGDVLVTFESEVSSIRHEYQKRAARDRVSVGESCRPTSRSPWSTRWWIATARARPRRRTCNSSTASRAGNHREGLQPGAQPCGRAKYKAQFPDIKLSRSIALRRLGESDEGHFSPTAACWTRSSPPTTSNRLARAATGLSPGRHRFDNPAVARLRPA